MQAGIWINTPFGNGNQDHIDFMGKVGVGANGYGDGNNSASPWIFGAGNQVTLGAQTDGVYINGSSIQMTTGWVGNAWRTSTGSRRQFVVWSFAA